jgi:hypothetical protein
MCNVEEVIISKVFLSIVMSAIMEERILDTNAGKQLS